MLMEHWDYDTSCRYECSEDGGYRFIGIQCPECRRWFIPDNLTLEKKETRQVVEEKRCLEVHRMREPRAPKDNNSTLKKVAES